MDRESPSHGPGSGFDPARRRAVERVLASLPLAEREAVCLCLLAGKSTADVASILEVSRAQVGRLVARGLAAIARERSVERASFAPTRS